MPDALGFSADVRNTLTLIENTPEQIEAAMTVVAGSKACRGAADASELLQALGLIPYREQTNA